ncbi:hypothetical protein Patl1_32291 [Pistacia atlantica]|uniref:Uncharacterized protein n=1 Tax=Pistacia atlantica TaxID=434234 RepID=A0ACC1ALY2_9ROSI|nr:hypothetical protein Patl1_32291 [Pistacia atlantica]
MFWWLYRSPYRVEDPSKRWPILLWLQGGPGSSGVGLGNFIEMGPLDGHLKPKNFTWLKKADLLFVWEVGFSYVEDKKLLVKTDEEAASDLTILLKELFNENKTVQIRKNLDNTYWSDLTIFNYVIMYLHTGVALGDSWISPEDFVFTWAPFLKDVKKLSTADDEEPVDLDSLMNGPIKKKLKIIPEHVLWKEEELLVFPPMIGDFMKPRIKQVEELLAKGINVTIYNGQLDVICSTKGAEAWVQKLNKLVLLLQVGWPGRFFSLKRFPLYCGNDESITKGFVTSYKNLFFYWILGSGHFVPAEQPCVSLQMVGNITRSPNY